MGSEAGCLGSVPRALRHARRDRALWAGATLTETRDAALLGSGPAAQHSDNGRAAGGQRRERLHRGSRVLPLACAVVPGAPGRQPRSTAGRRRRTGAGLADPAPVSQLSTVIDMLEGALYGLDLLKLHSVTTRLVGRVDKLEEVRGAWVPVFPASPKCVRLPTKFLGKRISRSRPGKEKHMERCPRSRPVGDP